MERKGLKLLKYIIKEILESENLSLTNDDIIDFIRYIEDSEFEEALE